MESRISLENCMSEDIQKSTTYTTARKVLAKETGKALITYMRANINKNDRQTITDFFSRNYTAIEKIFKSKIKEVINLESNEVVVVPIDENLHLVYATDLDIKCILFTDERGLSFNYVEDKDIINDYGEFKSKGEIILKCGLNKVVYR